MLKQAQIFAMIKVMEKFANTSAIATATPAATATTATSATTTATPATPAATSATTPATSATTPATPATSATTPATSATTPATPATSATATSATATATSATTPATTEATEDKKGQKIPSASNTAVVNTMDTLKWVFLGIGIFVGLLLIGGLIYWIYTMANPSPQSSQQSFKPLNSSTLASSSLAIPLQSTSQASLSSQPMNYSSTLDTALRSDDLNMYTTLENDNSIKQFDSIDDYLPSMDTLKTSNNADDNIEFYDTNTKSSLDNDGSQNYSYVSDTDLPSTQEDGMRGKQPITGGVRKTKSRNLGSKKNQRKSK
jgi:hypothetical protein